MRIKNKSEQQTEKREQKRDKNSIDWRTDYQPIIFQLIQYCCIL